MAKVYSRPHNSAITEFNKEDREFIVETINKHVLPNTGWVCLSIKSDHKGVVNSALLKQGDNKFLQAEVKGLYPVICLYTNGNLIGKQGHFDEPEKVYFEEIEKPVEKTTKQKEDKTKSKKQSEPDVEVEEKSIEDVIRVSDNFDLTITDSDVSPKTIMPPTDELEVEKPINETTYIPKRGRRRKK